MQYTRWQMIVIFTICILGCIIALPNSFSESMREKWPAWLPHNVVNLGLDLQGGSHLLLEVEFEKYVKEQYDTLLQDVRVLLRKQQQLYTDLTLKEGVISFHVREGENEAIIKTLRKELGNNIEISSQNDLIELSFTKNALHEMQKKVVDQSIEIVRRRVDETGTKEPSIQRQGEHRIVLQVPGLHDPAQLKRVLGKTAKLAFHLVESTPSANTISLPFDKTEARSSFVRVPVQKNALLTGDQLTDATATVQNGEPVVSFRLNMTGAKQFGRVSTDHVGQAFAIVLDNKIISAPVIREPILGGSGIISGNFTFESANELAILLRAGALPAPIKILEERSVGPSLGSDSIEAGKMASIIGVLLVVGFMLWTYGLFGLFANIALCINIILIIAAMSLLQATLTMPGIAGMVLTLGMAVDANVLIYERMREELSRGANSLTAIEHGFKQASATIMDSNITTLIAAALLYIFGSGAVKGFAVTLTIGIVASMFTAITVSRMLILFWYRKRRPKLLPL